MHEFAVMHRIFRKQKLIPQSIWSNEVKEYENGIFKIKLMGQGFEPNDQ